MVTACHLCDHEQCGNGNAGGAGENGRHPHNDKGRRRLPKGLGQRAAKHGANVETRRKNAAGTAGGNGQRKSQYLGKNEYG